MTEHEPQPEPPEGAVDLARLESMVRAAGGYVGASDDLRPKVLEASRSRALQRTLRERAGWLACALLFVVTAGGMAGHRLGEAMAKASPAQRVATLQRQAAESDATPHQAGFDLCWRLVDAFMQVRYEQAEAFHGDRR